MGIDIPKETRAAAGGVNIEARKVAFIKQMTGQAFRQLGAAQFVGQYASASVQKAWDQAPALWLVKGMTFFILKQRITKSTEGRDRIPSAMVGTVKKHTKRFLTFTETSMPMGELTILSSSLAMI